MKLKCIQDCTKIVIDQDYIMAEYEFPFASRWSSSSTLFATPPHLISKVKCLHRLTLKMVFSSSCWGLCRVACFQGIWNRFASLLSQMRPGYIPLSTWATSQGFNRTLRGCNAIFWKEKNTHNANKPPWVCRNFHFLEQENKAIETNSGFQTSESSSLKVSKKKNPSDMLGNIRSAKMKKSQEIKYCILKFSGYLVVFVHFEYLRLLIQLTAL